MTYFFYHLLITLAVALFFGVFIDVDHTGASENKVRCALSVKPEDCVGVGIRGIFHNLYLYYLVLLGVLCWTIHLFLDGIFGGVLE